MIRKTVLLAVAIGLFLTVPAWSAPPQINDLAPLGGQRGVATELTISGSNLAGNPRLIAPFGFQLDPPAAAQAKSDASNWKLKLTIAPDVAVGVYPIRVQTDDGISNPFLLAVGQLPQVVEKEDNSTFETAQSIPDPPLVVEGQVAGNDVDFFRFHGKKGQFIVVDAQCARIGSGIDPTIRLTTAAASRAYVASADDSPGLSTDARLTAVLPGGRRLRGRDLRFAVSGSGPAGLSPGDRGSADGRGGLSRWAAGGRNGRPGASGRDPLRSADRRGDLEPAVRIPSWSRLGSRARCWARRPAGAPVLDVESLAPLVVSPYPELREAADPLGCPRPGRRTGRVQRPDRPARRRRSLRAGDDARRAAADQGGSRRARLGARRRCCRCSATGLGDRQRRRHDRSRCRAQRPAGTVRSSFPTRRSTSRSPAAPMRSRW